MRCRREPLVVEIAPAELPDEPFSALVSEGALDDLSG
jgi:hypothetical protein